ncbi:iron-sulfur cluster-binding protein [Acuticoccus mangrovi]|uniref:FAD-binding FR-type domain-containing protein n=1 Tax=Acuticoccus mangrovi TaxID=2796142 RepID=A0A934IJR0_9HYPH|nr:hypothetical protein [Acuticoccus mangrovi]MBJ3776266.1 hypothetical protein [Acuticoccus mangrovi]
MSEAPIFDGDLKVLGAEEEAGVVMMTLESPPQFAGARPGQFLLASANRPGAPLLGRPLSILSVEPELRFGFGIVGAGTRVLAEVAAGETVHVVGPLGHPFPDLADDVLIVTDTSHFGTLLALAEERDIAGQRLNAVFVTRPDDAPAGAVGAAEQDSFVLSLFAGVCNDLIATPLDGLEAALDEIGPAMIAAGASDTVMARLQAYAEARSIPGHAALQAPMACGIGACLVCIRRLRSGEVINVCEGPVAPLDAPVFA